MKTRPVPRSRRRLRKEAVQSKTRRRARSGRAHRVGSRAWLLRASLVAVITISAVGLLGTGGTIGVVDYFAGDLPSIDQLQSSKLEQTTRIVDRNGNLIAAVYHENRTVVPLSKISKNSQSQIPRAGPRGGDGTPLHEAADPRAVPQHHQLRQRRVGC